MTKKNNDKAAAKKKAPARTAAAGRKAKTAETPKADGTGTPLEAALPEAIPAETAKETPPKAKPAPRAKKAAPKAKTEKAEKKKPVKKAAEPVEAVKEEAPKAEAAEPVQEQTPAAEPAEAAAPEEFPATPRRSVVFIGSECYPFVKTGGLGDVMYALPKELVKQNCDVKVMLPRYKCIPWEYQEKMVFRGSFDMDLCADGRSFYVGIMEYVWDGVVYDFIDNEEFFSSGSPTPTSSMISPNTATSPRRPWRR